MNGHEPVPSLPRAKRFVRRLRQAASSQPCEVSALPDRDGDAGRPSPLPEVDRRYLYVSEEEIRELAQGRVPAIVQRQAQVALMSPEEWVRSLRKDKEEETYARRRTMDDATSSRTASTD